MGPQCTSGYVEATQGPGARMCPLRAQGGLWNLPSGAAWGVGRQGVEATVAADLCPLTRGHPMALTLPGHWPGAALPSTGRPEEHPVPEALYFLSPSPTRDLKSRHTCVRWSFGDRRQPTVGGFAVRP